MARQLKVTVYLPADDQGVARSYGPGDDVPQSVIDQITNPDVWADDDTQAAAADTSEGPPPKAGKGSGRDAWVAYAESIGLSVDEDASRDDIIAAVEAE